LNTSENRWPRKHASGPGFLRRSVRRFLPGETLEEAIVACHDLGKSNIGAVLIYLGENDADRDEAAEVTRRCLTVLERIRTSGLSTEIFVKLTQVGLDLNRYFCLAKPNMIGCW